MMRWLLSNNKNNYNPVSTLPLLWSTCSIMLLFFFTFPITLPNSLLWWTSSPWMNWKPASSLWSNASCRKSYPGLNERPHWMSQGKWQQLLFLDTVQFLHLLGDSTYWCSLSCHGSYANRPAYWREINEFLLDCSTRTIPRVALLFTKVPSCSLISLWGLQRNFLEHLDSFFVFWTCSIAVANLVDMMDWTRCKRIRGDKTQTSSYVLHYLGRIYWRRLKRN